MRPVPPAFCGAGFHPALPLPFPIRAATRRTLFLVGSFLALAAALAAQCTDPPQLIPTGTYTSGDHSYTGYPTPTSPGVTAPTTQTGSPGFKLSPDATATFSAPNCIHLVNGFEAHALSGPTSANRFQAWVDVGPTAVSVSNPTSIPINTGTSGTFTWTVSSSAASIMDSYLAFNTTATGTGACYIRYDPASSTLAVADSSLSFSSSFVWNLGGTATGPSCTISGNGANVTQSGNQLTVTVPVTFQAAFAGSMNEYVIANDNAGWTSGWQVLGGWTVPTYTPITLQSSPPGLVLSLGGQNCVAPCNYSVPTGEPIIVSALPQQAANGTYYIFSGWSDSGASTHTISSPSGTYTATMVPQDFTISMSAVTGTVVVGGAASYTISLKPVGNFAAPIVLSATNLPANATPQFSNCSSGSGNSCTLSAPATIGLTVNTASAAATNSTVVVNASSGVLSHNAGAPLSVQDYFLTISPGDLTVVRGGTANYQVTATGINGFTGSVNLGLTQSNHYWPVTGYPVLGTATPGGAATVSLPISQGATLGWYPFNITGSVGGDNHSTPTTNLQVTSNQDFTITPSGSGPSQSVSPGSTATFPFTITPVNGFSGYINLTTQYLPAPFVPIYGNGNSINLSVALNTNISIQIPSGTQPGTYQFNLQAIAAGGVNTYTVPLVLIVTGGGSTFTMTATPNQQTIIAGGSTTYTVTANGSGGFSGTVLITPNGGPPGTTITPSNATIAAGQPTNFTVQTASVAAIGNYPITFTGGYQGVTQATAATLTVAPPSPASMMTPTPGNVTLTSIPGNNTSGQLAFAWNAGVGVSQYALSISNGIYSGSQGNYTNSGIAPCPAVTAAPNCVVVTIPLSTSSFTATLTSTFSAGQGVQKYSYTVGSALSPTDLGYFPIVVKNGLPSPPIDLSSIASSGVTGCTAQAGVSPQLVTSTATSVTITAAPTLPTGVSATPVVCSTNSDGPVSFRPQWEIADPAIWELDLLPAGAGTLKATVTGFSPATGVVTVNGWNIANIDGPAIFVVSNNIPAIIGNANYTAVLAITDSTWEGSQAQPLTVNYNVDGATPQLGTLGATNGTPGDTFTIPVESTVAGTFTWALSTSNPPAEGDNTNAFQLTQPNCSNTQTCGATVRFNETGFANLNVTVTTPSGSSSGTIRLRSIKATITAIWSEQFPNWMANYLPNASDSSPCWNGNTPDTYDADNNINAGGQGLNPKPPCSGLGAGLIGNARQLLFVAAGQYPSSLATQSNYYVGANVTTDPPYQEALNNVLVRLQPGAPPAAPTNYPCCTNWIQAGQSGNQQAPDGSGSLNGSNYLVTLNALPYVFGGDFSVVAGVDRQGAGQANGTLTSGQPDLYTFALPCHAAPFVDKTNAPAGGPCNNGAVRLVSSDQGAYAQAAAFFGITRCALHVFCSGGRPIASSFLAAFVTGTAPLDSGASPTPSADCLSTSQLYYNTGLLLNNSCTGPGPTSGPVTLYTFPNGSAVTQKILQDPAFIELLNQTLQANKGSFVPGTQTITLPAAGCWATAVTVCNAILAFYGPSGAPTGSPDFYATNTDFIGDPSIQVDIPPLFPCGPNPLIQNAENAGYQIECDLKWAGDDLFNTLGRSGYRFNIRASISYAPPTVIVNSVTVSGYFYDTYQWNPYAGVYDPIFARLQAGFGSLWQIGQIYNVKVLLGDGTGSGSGFVPVPGYFYTFQ